MIETTATAKVVHNCNPDRPGQALPFGRRDPKGECPRCAELDAGAAPRTLGWVEGKKRQDAAEAQTAAAMAEHFASARHRSGGCGPVCTAFDW